MPPKSAEKCLHVLKACSLSNASLVAARSAFIDLMMEHKNSKSVQSGYFFNDDLLKIRQSYNATIAINDLKAKSTTTSSMKLKVYYQNKIDELIPSSKVMSQKQKSTFRMLDHDHDSIGSAKRIWIIPDGSKEYSELKYYDCIPESTWVKVVSVEESFDIFWKWLKEYGSTIKEGTKPMPTVASRLMFDSLKDDRNLYGLTLKMSQNFVEALKRIVFSEVKNVDERSTNKNDSDFGNDSSGDDSSLHSKHQPWLSKGSAKSNREPRGMKVANDNSGTSTDSDVDENSNNDGDAKWSLFCNKKNQSTSESDSDSDYVEEDDDDVEAVVCSDDRINDSTKDHDDEKFSESPVHNKEPDSNDHGQDEATGSPGNKVDINIDTDPVQKPCVESSNLSSRNEKDLGMNSKENHETSLNDKDSEHFIKGKDVNMHKDNGSLKLNLIAKRVPMEVNVAKDGEVSKDMGSNDFNDIVIPRKKRAMYENDYKKKKRYEQDYDVEDEDDYVNDDPNKGKAKLSLNKIATPSQLGNVNHLMINVFTASLKHDNPAYVKGYYKHRKNYQFLFILDVMTNFIWIKDVHPSSNIMKETSRHLQSIFGENGFPQTISYYDGAKCFTEDRYKCVNTIPSHDFEFDNISATIGFESGDDNHILTVSNFFIILQTIHFANMILLTICLH